MCYFFIVEKMASQAVVWTHLF